MPCDEGTLLQCFNKGCGQKFDPSKNTRESCIHHPGEPVFHDAYKGWSCCNKKCTDFTEFLNIKGCTKSFHSNVKPPEPEKRVVDKTKAAEVIEYRAPLPPVAPVLERPPFDTPLVILKPEVSPALEQFSQSSAESSGKTITSEEGPYEIPIGTACKNRGCKETYQGIDSNRSVCTYHPGVPVFHEGLKFWSCCQKRTTDFNSFLEQVGCNLGSHVWIKDKDGEQSKNKSCRYDWHQTAGFVVISIFAKKYDPQNSSVELSPIRFKVHLYFPEDDTSFDLDLELRGVVDVNGSSASMLPTKLEVKLRKAEPGSWSKLDFPRAVEKQPSAPIPTPADSLVQDVDAVDLSDL